LVLLTWDEAGDDFVIVAPEAEVQADGVGWAAAETRLLTSKNVGVDLFEGHRAGTCCKFTASWRGFRWWLR